MSSTSTSRNLRRIVVASNTEDHDIRQEHLASGGNEWSKLESSLLELGRDCTELLQISSEKEGLAFVGEKLFWDWQPPFT